LIVGGRGFVGAAIARHFLALGRPVHVFGPDSPVPLAEGASQTLGSIEDPSALRAVLAEVAPTDVVNLAAFSAGPVGLSRSGEADPERMLAVNVLGFRRLLEALVQAGHKRLIWMSSTVVLGPDQRPGTRLDEDAPRRPLTHYGMSKLLAEDLALYYRNRYGLETVGLRIPLMMGPGLWYEGAASPLKHLAAVAGAGARPVIKAPGVPFDAMHVADAGDLVEALLAAPAGSLAPIYHVAGFTTNYREIVRVFGEQVPGFAPTLIEETPAIVYPLVSQARVERDTGWRHRRDLRATLADMLAEHQASTQRVDPGSEP
jgi:UDP-glucose 4-epimerase